MCKLRISLQFWTFDDHEDERVSRQYQTKRTRCKKKKKCRSKASPPNEANEMKGKETRYQLSTNGRPCSRSSTARRKRQTILEAATAIESLMYDAGHVFKGIANFYMHGILPNSPSDVEFGQLLARNNSLTSPDLPPYCKTTSLISTRYVGFI